MKLNRKALLIGTLLFAVAMSGCATHYAPDVVNDPYGFFSGIWHGILFPWTFIVNVFSWLAGLVGFSVFDSIQLIGRPNTGLFYYIGFALGLFAYGGGA